jgi:hypothetical protein
VRERLLRAGIFLLNRLSRLLKEDCTIVKS